MSDTAIVRFGFFFFMALTRSRRGVSFAKTKTPQSSGLNSPGTVCRDRFVRPGRYRAFAPVNRRYQSGDAPPSLVAGEHNTPIPSNLLTGVEPAEVRCLQ